jgi:hypothetical protein
MGTHDVMGWAPHWALEDLRYFGTRRDKRTMRLTIPDSLMRRGLVAGIFCLHRSMLLAPIAEYRENHRLTGG